MTEAERARALEAAGWKSHSASTPSAADAWDLHKKRMGLGFQEPWNGKPG